MQVCVVPAKDKDQDIRSRVNLATQQGSTGSKGSNSLRNPGTDNETTQRYPWISGERIQLSSTGHAGVCAEGVAAAYLAKKPQLGIPCMGGRKFGLHQDDETMMRILSDQLEGIVKAVEETEKAGLTFPVMGWICPPKGLALMPIARKI
nr:DUF169 domain-containing protein [Candidatus Njordarchaeota archaeon]